MKGASPDDDDDYYYYSNTSQCCDVEGSLAVVGREVQVVVRDSCT